jgi:pimeloyl-ACP methyl ester carboxylesterase
MWTPVLDRLQTEREVVAIDLPGFGSSPRPPPGIPPGPRSLARLVARFLDEQGLERPHMAGNSLGGWIAFELAKQGRIRSATGLSPAGFHNGREAAFQRASLTSSFRVARLIGARAEKVTRASIMRKLLLAQYFAEPLRLPPRDAAESLQALAGATWFEETVVAITSAPFAADGPIRVPVTIAWGEKDRLLLPRQAPRAARMIPNARLVTLEGCGHVPTYDDPDQVARVLLEGSSG